MATLIFILLVLAPIRLPADEFTQVEIQDGPSVTAEKSAGENFRGQTRRIGEGIRQWLKDRKRNRDDQIHDDGGRDPDPDNDSDSDRRKERKRRRFFNGDIVKDFIERWKNRPGILGKLGGVVESFFSILGWIVIVAILYVVWPWLALIAKASRAIAGRLSQGF